MSKKRVQVGQVYQTVGTSVGRNWRVKATVDVYGIPHARIVNTDDEGETKTLSCQVLIDTAHYKLVEAAPAAA